MKYTTTSKKICEIFNVLSDVYAGGASLGRALIKDKRHSGGVGYEGSLEIDAKFKSFIRISEDGTIRIAKGFNQIVQRNPIADNIRTKLERAGLYDVKVLLDKKKRYDESDQTVDLSAMAPV